MTKRALISLLLLLSPAALFGQTATGQIVGTITDPSGAVISGAKVAVTNSETNNHVETAADANGSYQVLNLPIGHYSVSVDKVGFATVSTKSDELQINQTLRIDVRLAVGAASQSVVVEARAAQVETENPTIGGTVTGATIQNLPLNGRDTLQLATLQPGVTAATSSTFVGGELTIAGGRQNNVNYILDGANNTSFNLNTVVFNPNPDVVAEFRVLTNNYTAEYGRDGGGVVSVVIKSGTNKLHGSLYDYVRNNDFNASDYFSNAAGLPRPILKRNQFGGTFGGPVVLPKIVNGRNRLFFFFGYQGQRQVQVPAGASTQAFTPAELGGDFSHAVAGGPDPNVAKFLAANPYFQPNSGLASQAIIDPTKIDPVTQNFIKAGLIVTSPNGLVRQTASNTNNVDEYTGKFDFNATQNDRISATFGHTNQIALTPGFGPIGSPSNYATAGQLTPENGTVSYTRTVSPRLINEFRASALRYTQLVNAPAVNVASPSSLGVNINPQPDNHGGVYMTFDSGLTLGTNDLPELYYDTSYAFNDTLTWIRGRNTIKAGFSYNISQHVEHAYQFQQGVFSFVGPGGLGSGSSLADLLFGIPYSFEQGEVGTAYPRSKGYWSFVQDEWKVTPRLVLTLGLRYEYNTPIRDERNLNIYIEPGLTSQKWPNAPPGFLAPGDPGTPNGIYFPVHNQFAPRFGFAWDPQGDGRTSVRGGFGVFDEAVNAQSGAVWFSAGPPYFAVAAISPFPAPVGPITGPLNYLSNPYAAAHQVNPFPYPASVPNNLNFYTAGLLPFSYGVTDAHMKPGYIYQYNLSLQRQLGRTLAGEVSYIGNSAHRLPSQIDANPMILGTTTRFLNSLPGQSVCGPSACYNRFTEISDLAHSDYNGLIASLTKRLGDWHSIGSTFYTVAYTWSHMLSNADTAQGGGGTVPYYNHNAFYGNSNQDVRQRLVISGGWEIPFEHMWKDGPKRLTSGWSLFPIFARQSGLPLNFTAGLSNGLGVPGPAGDGDASLVTKNLAGNSVQIFNPAVVQTINGVTGNFYFNPNSFAPNPSTWSSKTFIPAASQITYGGYGRNSVIGPGFTNLDLSLEKKVRLFGEKVDGAFRVEAFNILNHPEFANPTTNSKSSNFGLITSVLPNSPSRILQLALRLNF